jgi:hypothetical protein
MIFIIISSCLGYCLCFSIYLYLCDHFRNIFKTCTFASKCMVFLLVFPIIILPFNCIQYFIYTIETLFIPSKPLYKPILITGTQRSGTTSLLRNLRINTLKTNSVTIKDMIFISFIFKYVLFLLYIPINIIYFFSTDSHKTSLYETEEEDSLMVHSFQYYYSYIFTSKVDNGNRLHKSINDWKLSDLSFILKISERCTSRGNRFIGKPLSYVYQLDNVMKVYPTDTTFIVCYRNPLKQLISTFILIKNLNIIHM